MNPFAFAGSSRRSVALTVLTLFLAGRGGVVRAKDNAALELPGPHSSVTARVSTDSDGRLQWSVNLGTNQVIAPSPIGIDIDGTDQGRGVVLGAPTVQAVRESYAWRGGKATATNSCQSYRIPVRHGASGTDWFLEVRTFDDGAAYRYRIPGTGRRKVLGETSSWVLPDGAEAWIQTNTGDYEGAYHMRHRSEIPLDPHRTSRHGPHPGRRLRAPDRGQSLSV
jgi:Glycosyl-hydrolase 97 N-terminal